jgi:hypothetical protein
MENSKQLNPRRRSGLFLGARLISIALFCAVNAQAAPLRALILDGQNNLIDQYPEIAERLAKVLETNPNKRVARNKK